MGRIRWLVLVCMSMTVFAFAGGCDVARPFRLLACEGVAPALADVSFEDDPDDPCLRKLTSDPTLLPTYAEVLASKTCEALKGGCINPEFYSTGMCENGTYRYLTSASYYDTRTYIFDASTEVLVSILETLDADPTGCNGMWSIAKIECVNRIKDRSLCEF